MLFRSELKLIEKLCNLLYVLCSISHEKIIIGDFNFANISWDIYNYSSKSLQENLFLEFLNANSLKQLITEPTRDKNILDLILTDSSSLVNEITISCPFSSSDHCKIEFKLNFNIEKIAKKFKCFKKCNFDFCKY